MELAGAAKRHDARTDGDGETAVSAGVVARASAPAARPLVLHISADYPDPVRGATTTAVESLVTAMPDVDQIVVSLNRTGDPRRAVLRDCGMVKGVRLIAYRYYAPPLGLGLAMSMRAVARRIATLLEGEGLKPDVIHAHKFAFEGIAGLWLARRWGDDVRLLVSVRGEADSKVLRFKPHYRPLLQKIADRASRIYHVSAWFRPVFDKALAIDPRKETLLPNAVGNIGRDIESRDPEPRFVCALNLDIRRRKGLSHLLKAFARFHAAHGDIGLDIIGGGSEESVADVRAQIARLGLGDAVRLLGRMDNADVTRALPSYLALVLPSFNETFGMVYVEALFAGIPILHGRGTGIDGYLDGIDAAVAATPGDVGEIAAALERLHAGNARFRAAIHTNAEALFARFDPEAKLARYRADLVAGEAVSR